MIGELTLDGRLRCVPGVLPMTMAAAARGLQTVFVPEPQTAEAAMVTGVRVFGVRSLAQVMALLNGESEIPEAPEVEPMSGSALLTWRGEERLEDLDMADVIGHGRHALRHRGGGGRGTPPDAHRAQGVGQDDARRAHPRAASRPHRRRVPRAHGGALPVRSAARRRLADHPTAVPGAAPLGVEDRASSAAAAAGCVPATSARPISGCSSSTSSRSSRATSSRPCASRWRPGRSRSRAARRTPPTRRGRCSCSPAIRALAGNTIRTRATTTAPAGR